MRKPGRPWPSRAPIRLAAGGTVSFDPHQHLQRSGLALVNGIVYVAFASQEDTEVWYGWMMGYQYRYSLHADRGVQRDAESSRMAASG